METQIAFCVVGHHSRRNTAIRLAEHLGALPLIDEGNNGANWNHRRAIEWAAQQDCRVVICEDDAVPVAGFLDKAAAWLSRFPDHLLSFYLGTGRPPQYQMQIAQKLVEADKHQWDCVTIPRLIHGVCYSVPKHRISDVLARWDSGKAADFAVGDACGGDVIYPCYSLVDHADVDTVEQHPDRVIRTERRRAWRLDI